MTTVTTLIATPRDSRTALGAALAAALLLAVLLIAVPAHSAAPAGRCQSLLANGKPTAYIAYEAEGCTARSRAALSLGER
jgi:hypothetical protein